MGRVYTWILNTCMIWGRASGYHYYFKSRYLSVFPILILVEKHPYTRKRVFISNIWYSRMTNITLAKRERLCDVRIIVMCLVSHQPSLSMEKIYFFSCIKIETIAQWICWVNVGKFFHICISTSWIIKWVCVMAEHRAD